MKPTSLILMLLAIACPISAQSESRQEYSELWGKEGEKWTPESRLPDFSFAGYRFGEAPLPDVPVKADVRDFGAVGDGKTDSTRAFLDAVASVDSGAILIPAGTYILSGIIRLDKSGIVLRGEGPEKTILHFTNTLEDVASNMGETTGGRPTSNYSWSGGFIWSRGKIERKLISPVTSESKRGSRTVTVESAEGLSPGQVVYLEITDDDQQSMVKHLYSEDSGDTGKILKPLSTGLVTRVVGINGTEVTLERPLRCDLRPEWSPVLKTREPSVREVGIEDLAIDFPVTPYEGHFTELGKNAIAMNNISDSWVRNVRITNCDSGIFLSGEFCTLERFSIASARAAHKGTTGHHGVTMGRDCLATDFEFETHFIHDFTLTAMQNGNVIKNGKGPNLSFDHHKRVPYENLLCNIDVGSGEDIWRCGGGAQLGKHCAARGTFWGITSAAPVPTPPDKFGPDSINLVGLDILSETIREPDGKWIEVIPPADLHPRDLHAAQLERRMKLRSK